MSGKKVIPDQFNPATMSVKSILLFVSLFLSSVCCAQDGFYTIYNEKNAETFKELIAVKDNEFAFITSNFLYRVNAAGTVLHKNDLRDGSFSLLQSIARDAAGNLWVASHVFEDVNTQKKVVYKINPAGQMVFSRSFRSADSFEDIKLFSLSNNRQLMFYKQRIGGDAYVAAICLDESGNKVWEKTVSDKIYNHYFLRAGSNGTADISYISLADNNVLVSSIDTDGRITDKRTVLPVQVGITDYTECFSRTADGGYVFAGSSDYGYSRFSDGLVYKTDVAGNLQWLRRVNINLGDSFWDIVAVPDGFILLGDTGFKDIGDETAGDMLLMKLDLQGNQLWTKSFGSVGSDFGTKLLLSKDEILFGGRSSYPGEILTIPALCKTNKHGELFTTIPFSLEPEIEMKKIEVNNNKYLNRLAMVTSADNGSFIAGGNFLNPDDDQMYPFLVKNDRNGRQLWYKQMSTRPGTLGIIRQIRPGDYLSVVETKDIFSNGYELVKTDDEGNINWTRQNGTGKLTDAIATADGGYLLIGAEDISFVNFEVVLIKLSANGQEQWRKTIGKQKLWEIGRQVVETPERDFLIVGSVKTEFDIVSGFYALKVDQSGNKIWERNLAGGIATNIGFAVTLTADGNYLFAGTEFKYPYMGKDILLIKTDKQGNTIWEKRQDFHLSEEGFSIQRTTDGGFFVAGSTGEPMAGKLEKFGYLLKINDEGKKEWVKYYGKKDVSTVAQSFIITSIGDTLLMGTGQSEYGKEHLYFVRLNGLAATPVEEPVNNKDSLLIYPNPAANGTALFVRSEYRGVVLVNIYDAAGRKVRFARQDKNAVVLRLQLPVTGLAPGLYHVVTMIDKKEYTRKILVTAR